MPPEGKPVAAKPKDNPILVSVGQPSFVRLKLAFKLKLNSPKAGRNCFFLHICICLSCPRDKLINILDW